MYFLKRSDNNNSWNQQFTVSMMSASANLNHTSNFHKGNVAVGMFWATFIPVNIFVYFEYFMFIVSNISK